MRYTLWILALVLIVGCAKQDQKTDSQAGTATQSSYTEVIGSNKGYIIENAKIVSDKNEQPAFTLNGALKLGNAKSSVLVIRGSNGDNSASTILALQFPAFAQGTTSEFDGSPETCHFVLYGIQDGKTVVQETGLVSGKVRFLDTRPSDLNLGLNRALMEGTGDMEILVSNIQPGTFHFEPSKKFAARYSLPIVKLEEIMRLSIPT